MALATAKEVITHVPCEFEAPRLPVMVDNATLVIVKSKICKNAITANKIISRINRIPVKGDNDGMLCIIEQPVSRKNWFLQYHQ